MLKEDLEAEISSGCPSRALLMASSVAVGIVFVAALLLG
jgi:hypothetical protein